LYSAPCEKNIGFSKIVGLWPVDCRYGKVVGCRNPGLSTTLQLHGIGAVGCVYSVATLQETKLNQLNCDCNVVVACCATCNHMYKVSQIYVQV